jgi:hypothetical protein
MGKNGDNGWQRRVMPSDVEQERHRLRESQMRLVLLAEELGLAVPRSCCPHSGEAACLPCVAEWLAANVHRFSRPASSM